MPSKPHTLEFTGNTAALPRLFADIDDMLGVLYKRVTTVDLTAAVSGVLPVTNGGTGTGTAFTAGSVVFAGTSGVYAQDNANLFWDDTTNRLGIGTITPSAPLTIHNTTYLAAELFTHNDTDWQAPELSIYRSRGTAAIPTVVSTLDTLGYLTFYGYNSGDAAYAQTFQLVVKAIGDYTVPGTRTSATYMFSGATVSIQLNEDGTVGLYNGGVGGITNANVTVGGGLFASGILISSNTSLSLPADLTDAVGSPRIIGLANLGTAALVTGAQYGASTQAAWFTGMKTRSLTDADADTIVVSGDGVIRLEGYAADGAAYRSAGYIELKVDGTPGLSDMPGRWEFYTTPDASATPALRLSINQAGNVSIGGASLFPSTGSMGLVFGDGTALATMASNTAGLYADDVSGTVEMFAINEAGTATQLTGSVAGYSAAKVMQRVVLGI